MSKPHKIERLFAWICQDETGEDGIPAVEVGGQMVPLIGSDMARMESLRTAAMSVVAEGKPIRLCMFSQMTVLEEHAGTNPGRHR